MRGAHRGAAPASLGPDRDARSTATCSAPATSRWPAAAGVFEDGTPFALPGETDHPPPLDLPESARNAVVYLAAADAPGRARSRSPTNGTEGRYAQRGFEAYDTHSGSPQPAECRSAGCGCATCSRPKTAPAITCIGLARIVEVAADRRVVLDDRWIPPALVCSAAPPLAGLLAELSGMLNQRGEALAARLTAPGSRGVAEVADFLLLQSVNRWQKLLAHWADAGNVHPGRSLCRAGADGRRFRDLHRGDAPAQRLSGLPA